MTKDRREVRRIKLEMLGDEISSGSTGVVKLLKGEDGILIKHLLPASLANEEMVNQFLAECDIGLKFGEALAEKGDGLEQYFVHIIKPLEIIDGVTVIPAYSMARAGRCLDDVIRGTEGVFNKYKKAATEDEKESIVYNWTARVYEYLLNTALIIKEFHRTMSGRIVADLHPGNLLLDKEEDGREHILLSDVKGYDLLPSTDEGKRKLFTQLSESSIHQRGLVNEYILHAFIDDSMPNIVDFDRRMFGRLAAFMLLLESGGMIPGNILQGIRKPLEPAFNEIKLSSDVSDVIIDCMANHYGGNLPMEQVYEGMLNGIKSDNRYMYISHDNGGIEVYTLREYLGKTVEEWNEEFGRASTVLGSLADKMIRTIGEVKRKRHLMPSLEAEAIEYDLNEAEITVRNDCEAVDMKCEETINEYLALKEKAEQNMETMRAQLRSISEIYGAFDDNPLDLPLRDS